jgi:hypothetical protein
MSDDPTPMDPVAQTKQAVGEYLAKTMGTLTQVTDELVKNNSTTAYSPLLQHMTALMIKVLSENVKKVVGGQGGSDPSQGGGPGRPPGSGGTPYQGD